MKKKILKRYKKNLVFSKEELNFINKAIELKIINSDDIIKGFWKFRDKKLKKFENISEKGILNFNLHFNNKLTYSQNFINLIKFLNIKVIFEVGKTYTADFIGEKETFKIIDNSTAGDNKPLIAVDTSDVVLIEGDNDLLNKFFKNVKEIN